MHVDLGRGQSAELIDLDDVPRKAKFKVQEWLLAEYNRENGMHATIAMMIARDMLLARVIVSWTLDLPTPNGDPQKLGDLPSSTYDKLIEAIKPYFEDLDFLKEGRAAVKAAAEKEALTTDKSSDSSPTSEGSSPQETNPIPVT